MAMYPDANENQIIETVGWSMILIILVNLSIHIGSLFLDISQAAMTLAKNYPLVVEPLYQIASPNAEDPDESEEDLLSEPEDIEVDLLSEPDDVPKLDFDPPGMFLELPPDDPFENGPSLPQQRCSVPEPRLVFDLSYPKDCNDEIDLAIPCAPEKPKKRPPTPESEPLEGLDLY